MTQECFKAILAILAKWNDQTLATEVLLLIQKDFKKKEMQK